MLVKFVQGRVRALNRNIRTLERYAQISSVQDGHWIKQTRNSCPSTGSPAQAGREFESVRPAKRPL